MPVQIHGQSYKLVAERIDTFREKYPDYSIDTEIVSIDDERVVMRALISAPPDFNSANEPENMAWRPGRIIATGHAEEIRSASSINRTSALENAETSAVGRALAFFGLAGTEIASADEVAQAVKRQAAEELLEYNALVREYWYEISEVKNLLQPQWGEFENQSNVTDARAVMKELGDDVQRALWKAPTKGGCFTTQERSLLKEKPEDAL